MKSLVNASLSIAVAAAAMGVSTSAMAGASANVGLTTDYVWRGWTQNDNNPSLSGGLDYDMNGFYVGTWAANVSNDGDDVEVDFYGGYAGEAGDFGYDIGVIAYMYPGATDLDFTEFYVNGSYKMIGFGLASTVSADNSAAEGDLYSYISYEEEMGPFGYSTTIGNTSYDAAGTDDVLHVNMTLGYSIPDNAGDLALAYDKPDDGSDSVVSLSWSKSFDF